MYPYIYTHIYTHMCIYISDLILTDKCFTLDIKVFYFCSGNFPRNFLIY